MAHLKNHVGKVRKKMKDYDSKRIYLLRGSKTGSETTRPSVRTYSGAFFPSPPFTIVSQICPCFKITVKASEREREREREQKGGKRKRVKNGGEA